MVQEMIEVPECTACGCGDVAVVKWPDETEWFPSGRATCNACGATFSFPNDAQEKPVKSNGVRYVRVRCPQCRQRGAPVYKTEQLLRADKTAWAIRRYHKCKCGHNFKSIEEV
jgi:hypothetical protein